MGQFVKGSEGSNLYVDVCMRLGKKLVFSYQDRFVRRYHYLAVQCVTGKLVSLSPLRGDVGVAKQRGKKHMGCVECD